MSSITIPMPNWRGLLDTTPKHMKIARGEIGVYEYEGETNNHPRILEYFTTTDMITYTDETPWCAAFVNFVLAISGLENTGKPNARSFLKWGAKVKGKPKVGDIGVIKYGKWQGHVGFVDEVLPNGKIMLLGGNQNNKVSSTPYDIERFAEFRRLKGTKDSTTIVATGIVALPEVIGAAATNGTIPEPLMKLVNLFLSPSDAEFLASVVQGVALIYIAARKWRKLKINRA